MPTLLAQAFSKEFLRDEEIQGFSCGTTDYQLATANWIKSNRVINSIETYGTEVWLFYL
jgi:hypothetical protein